MGHSRVSNAYRDETRQRIRQWTNGEHPADYGSRETTTPTDQTNWNLSIELFIRIRSPLFFPFFFKLFSLAVFHFFSTFFARFDSQNARAHVTGKPSGATFDSIERPRARSYPKLRKPVTKEQSRSMAATIPFYWIIFLPTNRRCTRITRSSSNRYLSCTCHAAGSFPVIQ